MSQENVEPEEFFEAGDQVVVFVKSRARPKGSSGEIETRTAQLWTIRNGKVLSSLSDGPPWSRRPARRSALVPGRPPAPLRSSNELALGEKSRRSLGSSPRTVEGGDESRGRPVG